MRLVVLAFALLEALAWGQAGTQPKKHAPVPLSSNSAKSPVSQRDWCKVLKSAMSAATAEQDPSGRSYLLDEVAGGLKKCSPSIVAKVLADSFTATLAIPEHEEEFGEKRRRLFSQRHQPDPAALEELFILQEKHSLQTSALKHLLDVDDAKLESLMPQAEPEVRADLLKEATAHAVRAKKFDHALFLLRTTSKDWFPYGFPYGEATQLMLNLPPERDVDKQEVFRLAMTADAARHSLPSGTEDFASMIVRFWKQIPPSVALEAIHQVLDKAQIEVEGATFNAAQVDARFRNEHDYRVFELLPVLKQLDGDEADRLLQTSTEAQIQLKQYPEGIETSTHSTENGETSKDAPERGLGGSIGASGNLGPDLMGEVNEANRRVFELSRMAEENPRQALDEAATLPDSVGPAWSGEFPRADAYLGIARSLRKRSPSVARDALLTMADVLEQAPPNRSAPQRYIDAMSIAKEMDDKGLVLHLLRSGMRQADRLRSVDADPDDPNLAIKAYWPSACAYSCLIMTASKISPQLALKQISEIQDPEIQLLLRVRLASQEVGAQASQASAITYKKSLQMFGGGCTANTALTSSARADQSPPP